MPLTSGSGGEPPVFQEVRAPAAANTHDQADPDSGRRGQVYHHFDFMERVLGRLRPAFAREATFRWFSAQVLGMAAGGDGMGVTSTVRALGLEAQSYDSLLDLFRSSAWSSASLRRAWYAAVAAEAPLLDYNGRAVLCSDGVKVAKDALRMPGVKRLVQESSDSGKGEHILGHMFGAVGVLAGAPGACQCVPLKVDLQEGMRAAAGWDGAAEAGVSAKTHAVQSVECAFEAARGIGRPCYLVMDRYFMCRPALRRARELNSAGAGDLGKGAVRIVTKAKSGCVAWEEPPEEPPRRGRPRKRGAKVDVFGLFESAADGFEEVEAEVGGERRAYEVLVRDLLWGPKLYEPVRFVLVRGGGASLLDQALVTTDRTLTAAQVIELYSLRWPIESAFRDMKQDVRAFSYRFWSKAMPRLERFAPSGSPDRLESVGDARSRGLILAGAEAVARFVAAACVATGVLQMLALAEPADGAVAYSEFRRTPQRAKVSVRTVRSFLARRVLSFIGGHPSSPMARFIRDRAAPALGYAPSMRRRGRR